MIVILFYTWERWVLFLSLPFLLSCGGVCLGGWCLYFRFCFFFVCGVGFCGFFLCCCLAGFWFCFFYIQQYSLHPQAKHGELIVKMFIGSVTCTTLKGCEKFNSWKLETKTDLTMFCEYYYFKGMLTVDAALSKATPCCNKEWFHLNLSLRPIQEKCTVFPPSGTVLINPLAFLRMLDGVFAFPSFSFIWS